MAMPFYTQDLSAKNMPLLGLNSTARNGIVTDTTGIVTSLPNQTMVSSFPSLLLSGSSFSTGINATMKWGWGPKRTDLAPPIPTSAFISLGIKNKVCILMVAVVGAVNLVIE